MFSVLIFGGTTEGRELAEFCAAKSIPAYVSVTTGYGAALLNGADVLTGKMDEGEMLDFIGKRRIGLVIDATHPYAAEATENIARACAKAGLSPIRVIREKSDTAGRGIYFTDADGAAEYLNTVSGPALITTGAKELDSFLRVKDYRRRLAVRVLPVDDAVRRCIGLGFDPERIVSARGPFSVEENLEQLRRFDARYLVTKDGGRVGGFEEKLKAAEICGAIPLIIRRPEETGLSLGEVKEILIKQYGGRDL